MVLVLKDGQGYSVNRPMHGDIKSIRCQFCSFSVSPASYFRRGDKSGLPRYNRARSAMVKHIYDEHFAAIHDPHFGAASQE